MGPDPDAQLVASIYNAAYMVRHYARGGRTRATSFMAQERAHAILVLGLACREAFNRSENFEALLSALVRALGPDDGPAF